MHLIKSRRTEILENFHCKNVTDTKAARWTKWLQMKSKLRERDWEKGKTKERRAVTLACTMLVSFYDIVSVIIQYTWLGRASANWCLDINFLCVYFACECMIVASFLLSPASSSSSSTSLLLSLLLQLLLFRCHSKYLVRFFGVFISFTVLCFFSFVFFFSESIKRHATFYNKNWFNWSSSIHFVCLVILIIKIKIVKCHYIWFVTAISVHLIEHYNAIAL